jgi:predicted nuclease with TOPRIM domain
MPPPETAIEQSKGLPDMGKTIPDAYSPATKETALQLLREAVDSGKTLNAAANEVADAFSDGPAAPTLMGWARKAGISSTATQGRNYSDEQRRKAVAEMLELIKQGKTPHIAATTVSKMPGMPKVTALRRWLDASADELAAAAKENEKRRAEELAAFEAELRETTAQIKEKPVALERIEPVPATAADALVTQINELKAEKADLTDRLQDVQDDYDKLMGKFIELQARLSDESHLREEVSRLRILVNFYTSEAI